jgi:DNA (cytosine-5)-methyltransferase 1
MKILDLFAGPGGWSEGLRLLGLADVGIETDDATCATRAAAVPPLLAQAIIAAVL